MPSASDFFTELQGVNSHLEHVEDQLDALETSVDAVKTATDAVEASVQQVNDTVSDGLDDLVTLGASTNEALAHNAKQNDTIICLLDKIARDTCRLVNEADELARLQRGIEDTNRQLADLYAATHAGADLHRRGRAGLRREIERWCPPPKPEPPCRFEPCVAPGRLDGPRHVRLRPAPDRPAVPATPAAPAAPARPAAPPKPASPPTPAKRPGRSRRSPRARKHRT